MREFVRNSYGGLDVLENDKFLLHLSDDDLKSIYKIQKRNFDIGDIRDRIPDWVAEQIEEDDYFFEDFNSTLFSDDEISVDEICQKILGDTGLIERIAEDLEAIENKGFSSPEGFNWWESLNTAIDGRVSIGDVMGELLFDKHHKELEVGRWKVVVLEKGDAYGLNKKLTYERDTPAVEFYDNHYNQFTGASYSLHSLLTSDWSGLSIEEMAQKGIGLCLYGDVREWTVAPAELNVISSWLRAVQSHNQAKSLDCVEDLVADAQSRIGDKNLKKQGMEVELGIG